MTPHQISGGPGLDAKARAAARRKQGFIAVLAAGATALALLPPATPGLAQFKADQQTVQTPFGRAPLSFADIVERVKPAVVSVSVSNAGGRIARNSQAPGQKRGERGEGIPGLPDDHPFNEFFKNLPKDFRGNPAPRPSLAQGSGFIISPDGYVVTNNHVVDGATKITASFDQDNKYDAELIGTDSRTDLALLKIKRDKPFPFVKFAPKESRVGDWVLAVGNPFGLGGTVTAGIVSASGRDIGSGPYDYLQVDAAVNRGNSGGPTFNLDGEVIGVNTAIYSPSGGNVGIAFAVPAKTAQEVIEQLKSTGSVSRGWLGVKIQSIDEDTAASLGLAEAKGALVSEVTPDGPAAAAGLKNQDAILAINGEKIADSRDLARKVAEFAPKTAVDVKIQRQSREQNVKVTLGMFPGAKTEVAKLEQDNANPEGGVDLNALGLSLASPSGRRQAGSEGVLITKVDSSSDAANKGLRDGDQILEVNGTAVSTPADVQAAVKKATELGRKAVLLNIKSADQKRIVAVQLSKA